jgi:hypothetical protein
MPIECKQTLIVGATLEKVHVFVEELRKLGLTMLDADPIGSTPEGGLVAHIYLETPEADGLPTAAAEAAQRLDVSVVTLGGEEKGKKEHARDVISEEESGKVPPEISCDQPAKPPERPTTAEPRQPAATRRPARSLSRKAPVRKRSAKKLPTKKKLARKRVTKKSSSKRSRRLNG